MFPRVRYVLQLPCPDEVLFWQPADTCRSAASVQAVSASSQVCSSTGGVFWASTALCHHSLYAEKDFRNTAHASSGGNYNTTRPAVLSGH